MSGRILVAVPDLYFAAKIAATAEACGAEIEMLAPAAIAEAARAAASGFPARPAATLVILDLAAGAEALSAAHALKGDPVTRPVTIVGFYSHVDQALRDAALAAGIDHVLPRSAFVGRLPELLKNAAAASAT